LIDVGEEVNDDPTHVAALCLDLHEIRGLRLPADDLIATCADDLVATCIEVGDSTLPPPVSASSASPITSLGDGGVGEFGHLTRTDIDQISSLVPEMVRADFSALLAEFGDLFPKCLHDIPGITGSDYHLPVDQGQSPISSRLRRFAPVNVT
jgi:hypothetical protein